MTPLLFFDYIRSFGGAQQSTATLVRYLRSELGMPAIFISPSPPPDRFAKMIGDGLTNLADHDIPYLYNVRSNIIKSIWMILVTISRIIKFVQKNDIDKPVIVCSSPKALVTLSIVNLVDFKRSWRIIYYARGEALSQQLSPVVCWFLRRQTDMVLSVSQETSRNLNCLGISANKIHTVHTSVDVRGILSNSKHFDAPLRKKNRVSILFAGSIIPTKGLHLVLKALQVHKSSRSYKILIAGDIPNEKHLDYLQSCQHLADSLDQNFEVIWLGWVKELADLFSQIDIVCLPTTTEGFPRLVVEAMAAGRLIMASPVGGITELIEDNHNGFLIELDHLKISEKLTYILSMENVKNVSTNATHKIQETYSLPVQVQRFLKALQR